MGIREEQPIPETITPSSLESLTRAMARIRAAKMVPMEHPSHHTVGIFLSGRR
jgi:hypothetical protein